MSNQILDIALPATKMLEMGVFAGTAYFPDKTASDNFYGVTASLKTWPASWIGVDKMGWFEWWQNYCNGRRLPEEDARQIVRWQNFGRRHLNGFFQACLRENKTLDDRAFWVKSKQAMLHWGIDVRNPATYHAFIPDKNKDALPVWWHQFLLGSTATVFN
jgi:hypothetical protein